VTKLAAQLEEARILVDGMLSEWKQGFSPSEEQLRGLAAVLNRQDIADSAPDEAITGKELQEARKRIVELERLVPDADVLDQVLDIAEAGNVGDCSDDGDIIGAIAEAVVAIRKYREAPDGKD